MLESPMKSGIFEGATAGKNGRFQPSPPTTYVGFCFFTVGWKPTPLDQELERPCIVFKTDIFLGKVAPNPLIFTAQKG